MVDDSGYWPIDTLEGTWKFWKESPKNCQTVFLTCGSVVLAVLDGLRNFDLLELRSN